ncbi:hypothetical protein MT_57028 [Pseudomonas phage phiPto-bp6g]|nr:hypothetical protein MT_57028 [Pseudomonas phage phiPto-bp6g]
MVIWKRKKINLGDQCVTELTILEWKKLFSIKLFNFHKTDGKQDRFHTHAFNAVSILLSGDYVEEVVDDTNTIVPLKRSRKRFLFIPANQYHRITKSDGCRTLLITGPWGDKFKELRLLFNAYPIKTSVWEEWVCGEHRVDLHKGERLMLYGEI